MKDRLRATPRIAIPLSYAFVCPQDHVYDSRDWDDCPSCADAQRYPMARYFGKAATADFQAMTLKAISGGLAGR